MNSMSALLDSYFRWINDNTVVQDLDNGWTGVSTPFLDRHNDGVVIFFRKKGDEIVFSDDGYVLNDLETSGVSFGGETKQRLLNEALNSFGVENHDGELIASAMESNFASRMHMFIQAILAINNMYLLNPAIVKSIFSEEQG